MIELSVCIGSSCHVNGAHNVVSSFQHLIEEYALHDKVHLAASFCTRRCSSSGVAVTLNGTIHRVPAELARSFFKENVLPLVSEN